MNRRPLGEGDESALEPWPANPLRALISARTWLATVHLLTDAALGPVAFSLAITGLATGIGLIPVALIGVLILLGTVAGARGYAALERRRFELLLDVRIPGPAPLPPTARLVPRARAVLTSGVTWRQLGYSLVQLPLGVSLGTITLVVWSVPIGLLATPLLPGVGWPLQWLGPVIGILLLGLAPIVVRGLAAVDIVVARALLGPYTRAELAGRVQALEDSRSRVVDAAESERRRIERDLHDGAQQRLVSLAMTLGRAQARYDTDPEGARVLLAHGQAEAKQALTELRNLTRGIHPPVLTDRGLDAALSGLAQRCPVPVTVEVDVDPRPSLTIESIAYFVVAEALTNVAKHANARCASVAVRRHTDARFGDILHLVVLDDGVGGADPAAGTGLAGLADRVSGVDGRLELDSPPGGPTVLSVELPCAS
ncbi:MAG: sensor histidine kinase [Pseudonocardiaceae bacterium]